jgi:hypothetical protein
VLTARRCELTQVETLSGWNSAWSRKHYREMIIIRSLLVPWIIFITVFLCAKGYWWGLVFAPFVPLDVWLLRNLIRYGRTQQGG